MDIPVSSLPNHVNLNLPVVVAHGTKPGPILWISGAVHGDEVNGVMIIRDLLNRINPRQLAGTIVTVPIVNVFGFINQSRYLPDRRDLNRSFPGSPKGSLAARLAHIFINEIVENCNFGIDIHTGSHNRINYPQIRTDFSDPDSRALAEAFSPEVIVSSPARPGTLRAASKKLGIPSIIYEAGEANRFDSQAIEHGVNGVLNVLGHLNMIDREAEKAETKVCTSSLWVRARKSGVLRVVAPLGSVVKKGQVMAYISDVYGNKYGDIKAPSPGIVIGTSINTIVYQGDAVIHLGAHL